MPVKDPKDQTSESKVSSTNRPPKPLPQDYSNLPQKPIKLKPDVSLPPVLKGSVSKARPTSRNKSSNARSSTRKSPPPPATAPGSELSKSVLEAARKAAASAGLPLDTWLENLMRENTPPSAPVPDLEEELATIRGMLGGIERRLERIERQKGFWQRFWQQYIEPDKD